MKKIFFTFFLFLGLFSAAFAENFYIENYDVHIKVFPDNSMSILENIDTNFTNPSHGIFRTIPLVNNVERQNGTMYRNTAKVGSIKVNKHYESYKEGNNLKIQIGDADKYVSGRQNYIIKYNYILSPNARKENEFYFNIIGNSWYTEIKKVNFTVEMPKEFDRNKIGLSIGEYKKEGFSEGAIFKTDGKNVYGYTTKTLNPTEGITLRIELPKGYFVEQSDKNAIPLVLLILVFILLPLIAWAKFGKDDLTIPTVTFAPPKGLSAQEARVIYSEGADDMCISAFILYMASKGYIKISEVDSQAPFGGALFGAKDFTLKKIKDYEGKKEYVSKLMDAIFNCKNTVSLTNLGESRSFAYAVNEYKKSLNKIKDKIYEKESISFKAAAIPIISVIVLCAITAFIYGGYSFSLIPGDIFVLIFPTVAVFMFLTTIFKNRIPIKTKILTTFSALFMGALSLFLLIFAISSLEFINCPLLIFALIGLVTACICLKEMPKKSLAGQRLLGQIIGFKKFIETAEKHQLEVLVNKDNAYCNNIIPFAYALDVGGVWLDKIKGLTNTPMWFKGELNDKNLRKMHDGISSASHINNSTTSSSSGGGGGFSGGGSGGGGGGSW